MDTIRLNTYIARHQGLSRRAADALIAAGLVALNDQTAALGARITPDKDRLRIRGHLIETQPPAFLYLMLNKPVGYVCSRRQQGSSPTIYSLLPKDLQHLKPVGRLDRDSSGLLLLTNDGDFAHRMTHPRFEKIKQYQISLDKPLQPLHRQMISDHGLALADGLSRLELTRQTEDDDRQWIVTMHEGRNRQIRRTFGALGYKVTTLHRSQIGTYQLGDILPGRYLLIQK